MFTGLVEEIGSVVSLGRTTEGYDLTVAAREVLGGARLGDSIAVNGVCLTIAALRPDAFTVGLAPETRLKTNLEDLRPGSPVNLERAALPTTRLGGHYVQGHVDATGSIRAFRIDEDALWVSIEAPAALMRYIVPKGYVAIDGVSLTVVNTDETGFDVTLVRYTQSRITLPTRKVGERVNLEVDILAKYVERLLPGMSPTPGAHPLFIHEGAD